MPPARPRRSRLATGNAGAAAVAGSVAVAVLLRWGYLRVPLGPDEAGYLLVAREWSLGGPNLYGHYWVDRAPALLLVFKLGSLVDFPHGLRLLVLPLTALFVTAAAWAGSAAGGRRAATGAAVVAAALATTPLVGAQRPNAELVAAPFVMVAAAAVLAAVRRPGRAGLALALLAGLSAGLAAGLKLNFVDGIAFVAVLLGTSAWQRSVVPARAARLAAAAAAGSLVVIAASMTYVALAGVPADRLWHDVVGFRSAATSVILDGSLTASAGRLLLMGGLAVVSGILPLLVVVGVQSWRHRSWPPPPLACAVAASVSVELAGIAGGGSYWAHYLIQLAPMLALAGGLGAARWVSARVAVGYLAAVTVAAAVLVPGGPVVAHPPARETVLAQWLEESRRPGDTLTVLYGNPDVQLGSGMRSPYPYLWSLPLRTLDPHQDQLRRVLAGPGAPTWVVVWSGLDAWGLDHGRRTSRVLTAHYRPVARVCDRPVWLHRAVERPLGPVPGACP